MLDDALNLLQRLGILQAITIGAMLSIAWTLYKRFQDR